MSRPLPTASLWALQAQSSAGTVGICCQGIGPAGCAQVALCPGPGYPVLTPAGLDPPSHVQNVLFRVST